MELRGGYLPSVSNLQGHFIKVGAHCSWSECSPTLPHPHLYAFLAEPSSSPGEPGAQKGALTTQNLPKPASSWRARLGSALWGPGCCAVQAQREKGLGWGNNASVRLSHADALSLLMLSPPVCGCWSRWSQSPSRTAGLSPARDWLLIPNHTTGSWSQLSLPHPPASLEAPTGLPVIHRCGPDLSTSWLWLPAVSHGMPSSLPSRVAHWPSRSSSSSLLELLMRQHGERSGSLYVTSFQDPLHLALWEFSPWGSVHEMWDHGYNRCQAWGGEKELTEEEGRIGEWSGTPFQSEWDICWDLPLRCTVVRLWTVFLGVRTASRELLT